MKKKTLFVLILIILIFFQAIPQNIVFADYDASLVSKDSNIKIQEGDEFYEFSKINEGGAILYTNNNDNKKGFTVCVNAGHGTSGGESVKTQCHPDGTAKVTGGTTAEGETEAFAVSSGMEFLDGTEEKAVTLAEALKLRDVLLQNGYNVLMIRETNDIQLDNIARTMLANKYADCHIAVHWDYTDSDKGAFYMKVPEVDSYKSMYPVSENWQKHNALGEALLSGLESKGVNIYGDRHVEQDLTQTSYSKVASIDIELGDKASDHSDATLQQIAEGLCVGVNMFFEQNPELVNGNTSSSSNDSNKKKGLIKKLQEEFMKKVGDVIDFFKFLLGDVPQIVANLIATIPDGTWKEFKTTYKYDDLANQGTEGVKNKYTIVSEGYTESTYSAKVDGDKEEFTRDTEIPVIPVDLYHFAAGRLKQLDPNIFMNKNDRTSIVNFVVTIIHVLMYISAAFLIATLIWHGINVVKSSITPTEKLEHQEGLNNFIKGALMLVGSVVIMALCIGISKMAFQNIQTEFPDELPIRVNVSGEANYSFSTTVLGYIRYKSDLKNTDMMMQKFLYALFYDVLAIANLFILIAMIARYIMIMYLSALGPLVACSNAMQKHKFIKMTFKDWAVKYLIWSLIILIIAIPYRFVLESSFKI